MRKSAMAACLIWAAQHVYAGSFAVTGNPITAEVGTNVTIPVAFSGDGQSSTVSVEYLLPNAFNFVSASQPGAPSSCSITTGEFPPASYLATRRQWNGSTTQLVILPAGPSTLCTFVVNSQTPGTYTFTASGASCRTSAGATVSPCSSTSLTVTIRAPTAPILSYAPTTPSVITYGTSGSAAPIVVSPSGGFGSGAAALTTLSNCAISGGGAAFPTTTVPALSFAGATTTPQNLSLPNCAVQSAPVDATLNCQEKRGSAAAQTRQWTLRCPAAAVVAPNLSYAPAPGSVIAFNANGQGAPITVTASGGAGSGAAATSQIGPCTINGGGAAFPATNVNGIQFTGAGTGSALLQLPGCTSQTTQVDATLNCPESRGGAAPVARQWTLRCPLGTAQNRLPTLTAPVAPILGLLDQPTAPRTRIPVSDPDGQVLSAIVSRDGVRGSVRLTPSTLTGSGDFIASYTPNPGQTTALTDSASVRVSDSAGGILLVDLAITLSPAAAPLTPPAPVLLLSQTRAPDGGPANNRSSDPSLSDAASLVSFSSEASNLSSADSNNAQDVFVRNRASNVLQRVSVDANGVGLPGASGEPAISQDGNSVAFVTGTGLAPAVAGQAKRQVLGGQVRVYDSRTNKSTPISNTPAGLPANGSSNRPAVAGNLIVYESTASNLTTTPDTNGLADIYVFDRVSGLTSLLSAPNTSTQSANPAKVANCGSTRASVAQGQLLVFESCQVLGSGVSSTTISNIWVSTALAKQKTLVSRALSGAANGDSNNAVLSADGSTVYFDSAASNLVADDSNGRRDVFRARITVNGGTVSVAAPERISVSSSGAQSDGNSERAATCGDGRYASFESEASTLFPGLSAGVRNILVKDSVTGVVARLSQNFSQGANGNSSDTALAPDCSALAFASEASNLSSSAQPGLSDVLLATNPLNRNYTGHWHHPAESGWGLTIAHQGEVLFPNWFTYDSDGQALWLGMSAGARRNANGSYSGPVYRLRGLPFNQINNAQAFTSLNEVGTATLTFTAANRLKFDYSVFGVSQSKLLEPLNFAQATVCENALTDNFAGFANYTDVWSVPSESGWGVHLTQQNDTLFGLWYTFDSNGRDQWLTAVARAASGNSSFTGPLSRLRGTPFASIDGAPSFNSSLGAGNVTFEFTDGANARMTYTLDGISQVKQLRRYMFGSPVATCRAR